MRIRAGDNDWRCLLNSFIILSGKTVGENDCRSIHTLKLEESPSFFTFYSIASSKDCAWSAFAVTLPDSTHQY